MKRLQVLAEDAGALQTKIHPGCAAHTPLMESARESLGRVLKEMAPRMRPPTCDVYINVTGNPLGRYAFHQRRPQSVSGMGWICVTMRR